MEDTARDDEGLAPEELEAEAGEELPDREAMTVIAPGAYKVPLDGAWADEPAQISDREQPVDLIRGGEPTDSGGSQPG